MHIIETLHHYYQRPTGKIFAYSCLIALSLLWVTILYAQLQPLWQNENANPMSTEVVPQESASKNLLQLSHEVAQRHLFGRSPQANAPTQIASHIKVTGIFLAADPKKSSAVMSVSQGAEANYWPGDTLPGGSTLREIRVDRVIIEQDGQLQSALFEMDSFPTSLDNQNTDKGETDQEVPDEPADNNNNSENAAENINTMTADENSNVDPANAGRGGFPLQEWRRFLQRDKR